MQALAFRSRSARDFIGRDAADQTASILCVFTGCIGNILLRDQFDAVEILFFDLLHGQITGQHITRVVQNNV